MMRNIVLPHFAAVAVVTALIGLIYASVQQGYRAGANDPQIQIARDIAYKLELGKTAAEVVNTADTVNLQYSLAPFVQLYNDSGKLIASTGYDYNRPPIVPTGALTASTARGENNVTWQPTEYIRVAAVIVHSQARSLWHGYVLAGRSLREVEQRESGLLTTSFLCLLACIGFICTHALVQARLLRKENK